MDKKKQKLKYQIRRQNEDRGCSILKVEAT